jgi:hypothetical protein
MTTMRAMLLLAAGATLVGCSAANPDEHSCAPYIAYGLGVRVANDQTGAVICDAVVTAREGTYVETLTAHAYSGSLCDYIGAIERAGTYSLHAEHAGFSPATASGITVVRSGGDCPHVRSVDVSIRLAPIR